MFLDLFSHENLGRGEKGMRLSKDFNSELATSNVRCDFGFSITSEVFVDVSKERMKMMLCYFYLMVIEKVERKMVRRSRLNSIQYSSKVQ